ncbi:hypothetical protein [Aquabacter spiritensis]|uniref:hypothetical protein n=1 Tax=Aquabacter spiritensis TaxID=933073 RepID=UPI001FE1D194|nr:hypothetical protein [Aquabacter spiritensis]
MEIHARYGRPLLVAETGAEASARAAWMHYVCGEVRAAQHAGAAILGICQYPILDYPGWDNGRRCEVGLLSMPDNDGRRTVCTALSEEIARQRLLMDPLPTPARAMAHAR